MSMRDKIDHLIANAWTDGYVCLLGSTGENGPNISPKGSMMLFDAQHLAYWERSKKKALENLRHDNRVVVVYANMQAQRDGVLESGILRFYGTAELHESGEMRDAIFARLNEREATHDGADVGIAVLIKIERAQDVRGKPIDLS
ncbi:MAG: pyridoxamine 5'-phosphate oxidase family protein [Beijerinckiaceae bacterium]|nr:pyridoxamine 5'-phosphate oxidase family protein [Beijerinckiaceae bacterium]MDO9442409.1 pyridoxamine 5'-phosphate oxidase family protein [Beijerinckiaceae bacterium]